MTNLTNSTLESLHIDELNQGTQDGRQMRVTFLGSDNKKLDAVIEDLKKLCDLNNVPHTGIVRLPTRTLKITTRKAPSGQGTNTYAKYKQEIRKRFFDCFVPDSLIAMFTSLKTNEGVQIRVDVVEKMIE